MITYPYQRHVIVYQPFVQSTVAKGCRIVFCSTRHDTAKKDTFVFVNNHLNVDGVVSFPTIKRLWIGDTIPAGGLLYFYQPTIECSNTPINYAIR